MNCEKCGKELPENETLCPFCGEEEPVAEQAEEAVAPVEETDVEEEVAEDITEEAAEPESDEAEPVVVRLKRGKARVIIGIIALVIAVALGVLSFLKPVLIIGQWKASEQIPISADVVVQRDTTMEFTLSGELILTDHIVNHEEIGYPADKAVVSNSFSYIFSKNNLLLIPAMQGEQQMPQEPITMYCSTTPTMFSYWMQDTSPRQVYDFNRAGWLYPSMYLWMATLVLLVLGVLLVAIPGKKCIYDSLEDIIAEEEFNQLLDQISDEIEADFEEEDDEAASEETTEEATDISETIEE